MLSHEERLTIKAFQRWQTLPRYLRLPYRAWLHWRDRPLHSRLLKMQGLDRRPTLLDQPVQASLRISAEQGWHGSLTTLPSLAPGERLGVWRIGQVLAQGGMGTVYRAHRDDGAYQQTVAIKCIRHDLVSPALVDSFLREREILAQLSHPGIARLIDGGVTAEGTPWLAMELVEGESIELWCNRQKLGIRERVQLFRQVCAAVSYAHAQGILHRDLKPANLLVTPDGHVKLVDFGIASLADAARHSAGSDMAFTKEYAAPELFAGRPAGVATDVYALGAALCKLLLGELPPQPGVYGKLVAEEVSLELTAIARQAPESVARMRGVSNASALARKVDAGIRGILRKCLKHKPEHRYSAVAMLADDLERWLQHRPVSLLINSRTYRAGKFLRRHRAASAMAACSVLLLLGGLFMVQQQRLRNAEAVAATTAINQVFEQTLGSAALSGLSATPLNSRNLLEATETRLRRTDFKSHPSALARGLSTLAKSYSVIGDYSHALALVSESHRLSGDDAALRISIDATLASMLNQNILHKQAEAVASKALHDSESFRLLGSRITHDQILLKAELAHARWGQADHVQSMRFINEAIAVALEEGPASDETRAELLILRGDWNTQLYQLQAAKQDLENAIALTRLQAPGIADNARLALVRTLSQLDRHHDAYALAKATLASMQKRYGAQHPETGRALLACSESARLSGDVAHARDYAGRAKTVLIDSLGSRHPLSAEAGLLYASAQPTSKKPEEELAEYRSAVHILETAYGPAHPQVIFAKTTLAWKLAYYACELHESDYLAASMSLFSNLIALGKRQHLPMPRVRVWYALALVDWEAYKKDEPVDTRRAKAMLAEASADILKYLGKDHSYMVQAKYGEARLWALEGRKDKQAELYREIAYSSNCSNPPSLLVKTFCYICMSGLGTIEYDQQRYGIARQHWKTALARGTALYGANGIEVQNLRAKIAKLENSGGKTAFADLQYGK